MTNRGARLRGIAGIDEAGRGPMIGPMVVCGVLVDIDMLSELTAIGVKDSKTLSPSRRLKLKERIEQVARKIEIRTVSASEIDERRKHTTLNEIEITEFVDVAKSLQPRVLYLDAADVLPERFGIKVGTQSGLTSKGASVISEHKADSRYPIVSAASIIAKVERDRIIESLYAKYGDFGSGYPTDPKTVKYVRIMVKKSQELPPIIRKSWESVRRIIDEESLRQMKLE